jgi:ATP-dependent RNA helicase SUPV3L1/SUV3
MTDPATTRKKDVLSSEAQQVLGATKAEFERWVGAGLVPVASSKKFRKWGKTLVLRIFDPEAVSALVKKVPAWREKHKKAAARIRKSAAKKAARTRKAAGPRVRAAQAETEPKRVNAISIHAQRRREAFAESLSAALGESVTAAHEIRSQGRGYFSDMQSLAPLRIFEDYRISRVTALAVPRDHETVSQPEDVDAAIERRVNVRFVLGLREDDDLALSILGPKSVRRYREAQDACARTLRMMIESVERVADVWRETIRDKVGMCRPAERGSILDRIAEDADRATIKITARPGAGIDEFIASAVDSLLIHIEGPLQKHLLHERTRAFQDRRRYDRYPSLFPQARTMEREIVFFCGPTNSGKTYEALAIAEAAGSAEILAPLRLLALEHYEAMKNRGLMAGMITGEEEITASGATHIARTIETMDTRRVVDVCVIDEIQMIKDSSRGWAWTRALVGVPARRIVLTGGPEAIPVVERICELTREKLTIHKLERKTALRVLEMPVPLGRLEPGDAIIAFSRRKVHMMRERVAELGYEVACIYGALGPEVRRAEAERFASGKAQILIATDAIGMGLNLPIRRILFSDLEKFDGICQRRLCDGEIRQIGGRAGRYGKMEEGFVGILRMCGHQNVDIGEALNATPRELGLPVAVSPDLDTVIAASAVVKSDRLGHIVSFLDTKLVPKSKDFSSINTSDIRMLIGYVDDIPLPLDVRWSYALSPFDSTNSFMASLSNFPASPDPSRSSIDSLFRANGPRGRNVATASAAAGDMPCALYVARVRDFTFFLSSCLHFFRLLM